VRGPVARIASLTGAIRAAGGDDCFVLIAAQRSATPPPGAEGEGLAAGAGAGVPIALGEQACRRSSNACADGRMSSG
jgi:hypothetical protein